MFISFPATPNEGVELEFDIFLVLDSRTVRFLMEPV